MRSTSALASLLALAALAACATRSSPPPTPLENTYWRLVDLGGRPAVGAGGQREASLQFVKDSGRVVGSTGCNRLTGQFTHDGAALRIGPAATTRMACVDPQVGQQEQAFLAALNGTERHEITGDTLLLVGSSGVLARLVAAPR